MKNCLILLTTVSAAVAVGFLFKQKLESSKVVPLDQLVVDGHPDDAEEEE